MPVFDAVGLVFCNAKTFFSIRFIFGIVSFKPEGFAVSLEGKDVGSDPIEEPAVMADRQDTTGEIFQGVFQSRMVFTSRSFVGSSNRSRLAPSFSIQARCTLFRSPPDSVFTGFCWSVPEKLKTRHIRTGINLPAAKPDNILPP